jgi:hypothetical protein
MNELRLSLNKYMNVRVFLIVTSAFNLILNIGLCIQYIFSSPDDLDAMFAEIWTTLGIAPAMILFSGTIFYRYALSKKKTLKSAEL